MVKKTTTGGHCHCKCYLKKERLHGKCNGCKPQNLYRVNLNLQHDEAVIVMAASEKEAKAKVKKIFSPYLDQYGFWLTEEVPWVKFKEEKPKPIFRYPPIDPGCNCDGRCKESFESRTARARAGAPMWY